MAVFMADKTKKRNRLPKKKCKSEIEKTNRPQLMMPHSTHIQMSRFERQAFQIKKKNQLNQNSKKKFKKKVLLEHSKLVTTRPSFINGLFVLVMLFKCGHSMFVYFTK